MQIISGSAAKELNIQGHEAKLNLVTLTLDRKTDHCAIEIALTIGSKRIKVESERMADGWIEMEFGMLGRSFDDLDTLLCDEDLDELFGEMKIFAEAQYAATKTLTTKEMFAVRH